MRSRCIILKQHRFFFFYSLVSPTAAVSNSKSEIMMCSKVVFQSIWLIYIPQLSYHVSQKIRKCKILLAHYWPILALKLLSDIRIIRYRPKRHYQPNPVPALRMQLAFFTGTLCILCHMCHWANIQKVYTLIIDFNTTTGLDLMMSSVGFGEKTILILEWVIAQKSF